jgi:hypothetical protein
MPNQTITMSSANVPGLSAPAVLNWRGGKPTTLSVVISTTATSSATFQIQATVDDLQIVGGTSLAFWQGLSSAPGQPATTFNASTFGPDGVLYSVLSPIAAVRLSVTALSSGPIALQTNQGEGW